MKKSTIYGVRFDVVSERDDGQKPDNYTRETVNVLEEDAEKAIEKGKKYVSKRDGLISLKLNSINELAFADI